MVAGGSAGGIAVVLVALYALGWLPSGRDEGPPAPSYETGPDGVQVARLDVGALTAWCRARDLPEPPALDAAEPAIAEQLLAALELAAADRDGGAFGRVGMICGSLDSHRAAQAYFERAAALDPAEFRWSYYLGCVLQVVGRKDEAIDELERARDLDATYPVTYARLGQLYLEANRGGAAAAMFERYAELRPGDWLGHVGLGRVALERGVPEEALAHLERGAALEPDDFQVQFYLGRAHATLGNRQLARQHFDRAAELPQGAWFRARDPLDQELHRITDSVAALEAEFERLSSSEDWPALIRLGEEIVQRRSQDVAMMGNLASLYRKLRRFDDAHAMLDRALDLRPDSARLHNLLAELYLAERRFEASLAAADRALECDPTFTRAQGTRGRALLMLRRLPEAETALSRYVVDHPDDAASLFALAETHRVQGELAEAEENYARVLELRPDHEAARRGLAMVAGDR